MVDADDVEKFLIVADALHPEGKPVLLHLVPVVDGVAPPLAGGAEIVRRYPCDKGGASVLVQQKILPPGPYIYRVHTHIEGHIAHNAHTFLMGIFPHRLPLV